MSSSLAQPVLLRPVSQPINSAPNAMPGQRTVMEVSPSAPPRTVVTSSVAQAAMVQPQVYSAPMPGMSRAPSSPVAALAVAQPVRYLDPNLAYPQPPRFQQQPAYANTYSPVFVASRSEPSPYLLPTASRPHYPLASRQVTFVDRRANAGCCCLPLAIISLICGVVGLIFSAIYALPIAGVFSFAALVGGMIGVVRG